MDDMRPQANLASILEEKLGFLQKLLELTKAQAGLLENEEVEPFLANLEERQAIMDRIDALDAKAQQTAAQADDGAGALLEQIKGTLKQIVELDTKNTALAQKKMDGYRGELRETRETTRGASAYVSPPAMEDGIYFDTKK